MKESEAIMKWCPLSRVGVGVVGSPSFNRINDKKQKLVIGSTCLASQCMMWKPIYLGDITNGKCGLIK